MGRRRNRGSRRVGNAVGRLLGGLPWWVDVAAGVAGFAVIQLWAKGLLGQGAWSARSVDFDVLRWLSWGVLAFSVALAVRAAWRARQRRQWFARMCDLAAIRRLDWRRFEQLVAEAYRRRGFGVELTGQGGADGGVDVVLRHGKLRFLVQCKQWRSTTVGVKVVREMFGLMAAEGADGVVIVCTGGFTREAVDFARGRPVDLVDAERLLGLVKEVS